MTPTGNFTPRFLDELRARILTSDVVGKRVKLTRKGREHQGLCPFHNEKTPSFTVNDQKGFYHCFGCGAHGDIIRFLTDSEGLSFPEAVERLANQAGMELPKATPKQVEAQKQEATLTQVVELTCKWFEHQLQAPGARDLHDYLHKRHLSPEIVKTFRLGFAPDSYTALQQFLKSKHISPVLMKQAGLLSEKQSGGEPYDKFRHRLMFPICDIRGRVIAFGGRVLGDAIPKYLNSPETRLFHKGEILYNYHRARSKAFEKGRIVVSEGYMDVIALYRAGIEEAVAPLGTAITEQHLMLLWKCADEPILFLDGDNAGKRAMERAAHLALPLLTPGKSLRFALLPKGMDPDDLLNTEGPKALDKLLETAHPLSDILWSIEQQRERLVTPEDKAKLEHRIEQLVERIKHPSIQNHYRLFFREKMWKLSHRNTAKKTEKKKQTSSLENHLSTPDIRLEEDILAVLLSFPSLLQDENIYETLSAMEFSSKNLDKIRLIALEEGAFDAFLDIEERITLLREQGLASEASRLNLVRNSMGLTTVIHSEQAAKARLEYDLTKLHLLHLEAECHDARMQYTEEAEIRANAFQEEITLLKEKLHQMELLECDE